MILYLVVAVLMLEVVVFNIWNSDEDDDVE